MTIIEALKINAEKLKKIKINSPELDSGILLSFLLNKNKEFLYTYPEKELTKSQIAKFNKLIKQRLGNIPMAYILGEKGFYGYNFKVNKDVLVPRPETELMIDEVLEFKKKNKNYKTFIDIGIGSGCILITLAKEINDFKNKFIAIDISKKALNIARQNAKLHKILSKIKFVQSDLLKNVINNFKNKSIIITANLPYLSPAQIKSSPSIQKEPRLALVAGSDGLKYYKILFKQLLILKKQNCVINLYCEIDPIQTRNIKKLILEILKIKNPIIKKDYKGHDRLVVLTL